MQIKLGEIVNARGALQHLIQEKLPIRSAYLLQKTIRKIDSELQDYEQARAELVKKYGEEKQPEFWEVKPQSLDQFNQEHKELLDCELNLDVPALEIGDMGEIKMSTIDMLALSFLFEEVESPPAEKEDKKSKKRRRASQIS